MRRVNANLLLVLFALSGAAQTSYKGVCGETISPVRFDAKLH